MKRFLQPLTMGALLLAFLAFSFAFTVQTAHAQTLVEEFTDGTPDLNWDFNSATFTAGDTLTVADSTASTWGSYVGVFKDQGYTGLLYAKDAYYENFTVSSDIYLIGPPSANAPLYVGLAIKTLSDKVQYYRFVYRNSSSSSHGILKLQGYDGSSWHISKAWTPGADFDSVQTGWHNFKVTVKGNQFWAYFDGKLLPGCPVADDNLFIVQGYPGIFKYNSGESEVLFDNFEVTKMNLTSIATIQTPTDPNTSDASPLVDSVVTVQGIVSGVSKYGYFMQDDSGAWNGIYVYTGNIADSLRPSVGDELLVTGMVTEYKNLTEIKNVSQTLLVSSDNNPYPPVTITAGDFGEPYESVAAKVNDVTCTNPDLGYGEWEVQDATGTMRVDDMFYKFTPQKDIHYNISGIGYYSYSNYKLEPRDSSEIEELAPVGPTLPLEEHFTDGNFDLDWQINSYLKADGDTLYIADSTASPWGSYVGVFEDQSYTGILEVKDAVFEDYTISADIFLYGDPNPDAPLYTGLAIKAKDDELRYYRFVYRNSSSSSNGVLKLQGFDGSSWYISKAWNPGTDFPTIQTGWHNLKVTVKGNQFWAYLDGVQLPGCPLEDTDKILDSGYPGIFKYNGGVGKVMFDNFMVTEPQSTLRPYDIVINEINYNPAGDDTTEFIELYNNDNTTVDLSGYYFSDGISFTFPDGATLEPGAFAVVAIDTAAFHKYYGFDTPYQYTGGLSNKGETVVFNNSEGLVLDSVTYDDKDPWPTSPDGDGPSLSLKSPELDNTLAENWAPSLQIGGTPGAVNFPPNNPPSAFHLVSPADSTVFTKADFPNDSSMVTFCWTSAMDTDPEDTVSYVLTILDKDKSMLFDTTFASSDTCQSILPPDSSGFFYWFVKAVDKAGAYSVSDTFRIIFDFEVGIAENGQTPNKFELAQNYPNPFNPTTTISFKLPVRSDVKLYIYNALGQKIRTLVNKDMAPGSYKVVWDAKNDTGRKVASGLYFYELRAKNFRQVHKMILMK